MGHVRRAGVVAVVVVAAAVLGAGCQWPRPTFRVVSDDPYADDAPGDGVCRSVVTQECTLFAAVQEANAAGTVADVIVPAGEYHTFITVTGSVRVNWGAPAAVRHLGRIAVAAGGQLWLDGIQSYLNAPATVDGVLVARHWTILKADTGLVVSATGVAVLENTSVTSVDVAGTGPAAVANDGRLFLRYVTLRRGGWAGVPLIGPVLLNRGTGSTTLAATVIDANGIDGTLPGPATHACEGNLPSSRGHNGAYDESCALHAPGDLQGPAVDTVDGRIVDGFAVVEPAPGSPLVDAIPVGDTGCGTDVVVDIARAPRPIDGDGDGTAACDIGSAEVLAPAP